MQKLDVQNEPLGTLAVMESKVDTPDGGPPKCSSFTWVAYRDFDSDRKWWWCEETGEAKWAD